MCLWWLIFIFVLHIFSMNTTEIKIPCGRRSLAEFTVHSFKLVKPERRKFHNHPQKCSCSKFSLVSLLSVNCGACFLPGDCFAFSPENTLCFCCLLTPILNESLQETEPWIKLAVLSFRCVPVHITIVLSLRGGAAVWSEVTSGVVKTPKQHFRGLEVLNFHPQLTADQAPPHHHYVLQ